MKAYNGLLVSSLLLVLSQSISANITISNINEAGVGFNDTTSVNPVTGNPATTLGQQRLNVFQAAANYWANYLQNEVLITVQASMVPLDCNANSALLGYAGTTSIYRDFLGAPKTNTWYPAALANELYGSDLAGDPEINSTFNSSIDNNTNCLANTNWWYGIGTATPSGYISLYDVVLHEIAHGLGFLTFVSSSGQKFYGYDDHYMIHLKDNSTSKLWSLMTDSERAASAIGNQLIWTGEKVKTASNLLSVGRTTEGYVKMFAPSPYQNGSSVSHWDTSLTPNELMEPYTTLNPELVLTKKMFCDIGWPAPACTETPPPAENGQFTDRILDTLLPALIAAEQASTVVPNGLPNITTPPEAALVPNTSSSE